MTGTTEGLTGPNYISSRSADVILSDVRPIKLKLDALRSINVLLDEFLYNLLKAAGSLTTDKLKTSLIKILPTTLGKEAILEAEIELKAYWERTTASPSAQNAGDTGRDFDLQLSFELLRLKCEAYTTMNDGDEDVEAEKRLIGRMASVGVSAPPQTHLLAPAALYLTAILEHVCDVSRVASRDSSRTVATVQDLFVALCEDDSMYSMFKAMKVYEQIESVSKAQPPRRSKSFSKSNGRTSPANELHESTSTATRLRISSDSLATAVNGASPILQRSSTEKSRVAKIMNRSSSDNGDRFETGSLEMKSQSGGSQTGHSLEFMEDAALLEEFDELMRSGATMKVSLTPDRLRSMEVYKQERKRQAQNGGTSPTSTDAKRGVTTRKPSVPNVDAIAEDEESHNPQSVVSSPPSAFQQTANRSRQSSLSRSSSTSTSPLSGNPRARSISVSAVPLLRSKSDMPPPPPPSHVLAPRLQKSVSASAKMTDNSRPQRTRKMGRKRESLDLDDIMNASDEEEASDVFPAPSPVRSNGTGPPKPYISKAARELIDFLDEGPPEERKLFPANASMISFESSKSKSGRFQRMMSRLTIGGSRENLNGRGDMQAPKTPRSTRSPYGSIGTSSPGFSPSSLNSKRSMPNVIVATPPPPPSMLRNITPPQATPPPSSHASTEDINGVSSPGTPTRRQSVARKAVPVFDGTAISQFPLPPTRIEDIKAASILRPVNGNGAAKLHAEQDDGVRQRKESSLKTDSTHSSALTDHRSEPSENTSPVPEVLQTVPIRSSSKKLPKKAVEIDTHVPEVPKTESKKETAGESTSVAGTFLSEEDVAQMRKLLAIATTAEECRLLVDMFLARNGSSTAAIESTPTPALVRFSRQPDQALKDLIALNDSLERALVGLLLSGEQEEAEGVEEVDAVPPSQTEETVIPHPPEA
ncbi:unnamed protein product [Somion occarium]|uniref:Uncharacterized protein n=1 Tax=Somion occarium TaxID=3059160 RepID=A0ABP1CWR2_9APHY